jgi:hypothetical protein
LISAATALALTLGASTGAAGADASDLQSPWHVHDGQGATLGPRHKGIGFFPTILGISTADYPDQAISPAISLSRLSSIGM